MPRFRQALVAVTLSTLSWLTFCVVGAPVEASLAGASVPKSTPPAPSPSPATTYVVRADDYLTGIALKVGVTMRDLLAANHLKITSVIHPGDTLVVPAGAVAPAALAPTPAPNTVYVVKSGDSLIAIAANHGVKVSALLAANKIKISSAIHPGTRLAIPPATMPLPAATKAAVQPTSPAAPSATASEPVKPTARQRSMTTLLSYLREQVGKPYQFNSAGPDSFDCSGLVTAAYAKIGMELPHQSLVQSTKGVAIDWTTQPIMPGDLVFMYSSASPTAIGHVGVAVDSTNWIQAARTGTPVRIGPMPSNDKIRAVRRIIQG